MTRSLSAAGIDPDTPYLVLDTASDGYRMAFAGGLSKPVSCEEALVQIAAIGLTIDLASAPVRTRRHVAVRLSEEPDPRRYDRDMKRTIHCGKIDLFGRGRRTNEADLELELVESESGHTRFSCCGAVWNSGHTDCEIGGQCLDEMFRHEELAPYREVYDLWKRHHLNDMHAGTEAQEAEVEKWKAEGNRYDYAKACERLESAGLLRDPGYLVDGKPYLYGSAWLTREIPPEDEAKIRKWILGGTPADGANA